MKQGFVMFLAVLFLSIEIALAQTQVTGTVAAAEDGSPVIGASIKPKSVIVYSNIFYTFAFVNDIKKWNKAVRPFVVKTVSNV